MVLPNPFTPRSLIRPSDGRVALCGKLCRSTGSVVSKCQWYFVLAMWLVWGVQVVQVALPVDNSLLMAASQSAPASHSPENVDAGSEEHASSFWSPVARVVNFSILVGVLVYLLRSPVATYLKNRSEEVHERLASVEVMKASAQERLEALDEQMAALPGELEALRTSGAKEIEAQETRIREETKSEHERLLEQTHRELDFQARLAKGELIRHAADLAVEIAEKKIRGEINNSDQQQLMDQYINQVDHRHE